ncbi:unnamed protein product [Gongylonema pulchrum]|uniref:Med13_N domain-containing protein n=1 Tax=Gongylonema pulchrum TaxID=637853 RepID=A0A183EKL1_9BILA|nr:unnamed protein product [Gongylonema pulchrum]
MQPAGKPKTVQLQAGLDWRFSDKADSRPTIQIWYYRQRKTEVLAKQQNCVKQGHIVILGELKQINFVAGFTERRLIWAWFCDSTSLWKYLWFQSK